MSEFGSKEVIFNDTTSNIKSTFIHQTEDSESISSNKSGNEDENWRKVLNLCHQTNPIPFGLEFPSKAFDNLEPIDTGSYSLVSKGFDKRIQKEVVFKIINVVSSKTTKKLFGVTFDGKQLLSDVFNEIMVSKCLSNLHITTVDYMGHQYLSHTFPRIVSTRLVQGCIPNYLRLKPTNDSMERLEKIEMSRETPGTPREYLVITMKNCGQPLWKLIYQKSVTANQLLSVCYQLTLALAVAECLFEFEHRDLHIANVLLKKTKKKSIKFVVKTKTYYIQSFGIKAYIIDTTFSRMKIGENVFFTSLTSRLNGLLGHKSPDLQEWVYIRMAEEAKDDWHKWNPQTNLFWLRYFYRTVQISSMVDKNKDIKPKQKLTKLLNKITEYKTLDQFIKYIEFDF